MLDNDNIITSVSEAVEKIPADEKDYRKCSFIVFCFAQPQHKKSRPTYIIASSRNSCLPARIHSVQLQSSQKTFYIKFKQKKGLSGSFRRAAPFVERFMVLCNKIILNQWVMC